MNLKDHYIEDEQNRDQKAKLILDNCIDDCKALHGHQVNVEFDCAYCYWALFSDEFFWA